MGSRTDQALLKRLRLIAVVLVLAAAGCSDDKSSDAEATTTTVPASLTGVAAGAGRLDGYVGPGRPGENGVVPQLSLSFSDGKTTIKTTVQNARYTVDLPAGIWEVRSDDGNICATGLRVTAAAVHSNDLIWPNGSCQVLSGPPANPSPPTGPSPPPR